MKSYSGDNRVVAPESSHRRRGLLHRCRLYLSWKCRNIEEQVLRNRVLRTVGFQGCGCSPIKRYRELGSERCEAVCLISTGDVLMSEGNDRLVREERWLEASGLPVV